MARQHARTLARGRRAARAGCETTPLDLDISGAAAGRWVSNMVGRPRQTGQRAGGRRDRPADDVLDDVASKESLISIQPETRADAARCGRGAEAEAKQRRGAAVAARAERPAR